MIVVEIESVPSCSLILPEDLCLVMFSFLGKKIQVLAVVFMPLGILPKLI